MANPPKKTRRRLLSKYEGRRLSFSDAVNEARRSEELNVLFNSLDRFEKLWMEQQKRLKSSPASRKEELDRKISILMSMRFTLVLIVVQQGLLSNIKPSMKLHFVVRMKWDGNLRKFQ